jgi:hypothetical protein
VVEAANLFKTCNQQPEITFTGVYFSKTPQNQQKEKGETKMEKGEENQQ